MVHAKEKSIPTEKLGKTSKNLLKFNEISLTNFEEYNKEQRNLIHAGKNLSLGKNFYCEYGNIYALDNVQIGRNCRFFDEKNIFIGNDVVIEPNVTLRTNFPKKIIKKLNYNIYIKETSRFFKPKLVNPEKDIPKTPKPIIIYNNVRIESCSIILPGVIINNNSIVKSGSIVDKSVPANVIVSGCPAKIIRRLRKNQLDKFEK